MNTQVLLAGAGPVGLTMAIELARYGVPLRIVDRAAQRSDNSKALVVWSRTLELLERAGCSAALVAAGHRVLAANIVAGEQRVGRIDFTRVDSPYPYALMLPQSDTERLLEAHLNLLGVVVERQVRLTGFTDSGSAVTATLAHADGREEQLTTDWLIGCDGAHSAVRHGLGLPFDGDTLNSDWVLADVHVAGLDTPDSELAIYWHEEGVLALFPISLGRYRVIANIGASQGLHPVDPTLAQIQDIVERRGPGHLGVTDPVWLSGFRINERKVKDYRRGRGFVAGDAAHVHSPAGGQGMNTGMQDAFNLAWKLALVCRGTCAGDMLLDSYGEERGPIAEQVLADSGRLTALVEIRNQSVQKLRNLLGGFLLGLAPVGRLMASSMSEVSVGYPHSLLAGPDAHRHDGPAAGRRVPPSLLATPVGAGDAPRFVLFGALDRASLQLLTDYAELLEPVLRPPFAKGYLWLVRPDSYVACVARAGDIRAIADYLGALSLIAGDGS
jgi:2-polyprenyl-6-methoxyphenol hydroxylase-like FAD-dependent oxidoreductase